MLMTEQMSGTQARNDEIRRLHAEEKVGWQHLSKVYGLSQTRIRQICDNRPNSSVQRHQIIKHRAAALAAGLTYTQTHEPVIIDHGKADYIVEPAK
jgi:hypothetical protein